MAFGVIILLAAASTKVGAAQLSIPTNTTVSCGSVNINVTYRSQRAAVSAVQFDLEYDRKSLNITTSAGPAITSSAKSLTTSVLANGSIRFLVAGLNQNTLVDGDLANLTVQFKTSSKLGPYTLLISNATGADPSAQKVPVSSRSGRVVKIGPRCVMED
jgi:Cohesin domain